MVNKVYFTGLAPDFILPNQHGENVNLRQFHGKWVIVYFYLQDFLPACTQEALEFNAKSEEFKRLNAVVLGISGDSIESHLSFAQKHQLTQLLLSDKEGKTLDSYGTGRKKENIEKKKGFAKSDSIKKSFSGANIIRTTFLIDHYGRIAHIWDNVKVNGHAQEVLDKMKIWE